MTREQLLHRVLQFSGNPDLAMDALASFDHPPTLVEWLSKVLALRGQDSREPG